MDLFLQFFAHFVITLTTTLIALFITDLTIGWVFVWHYSFLLSLLSIELGKEIEVLGLNFPVLTGLLGQENFIKHVFLIGACFAFRNSGSWWGLSNHFSLFVGQLVLFFSLTLASLIFRFTLSFILLDNWSRLCYLFNGSRFDDVFGIWRCLCSFFWLFWCRDYRLIIFVKRWVWALSFTLIVLFLFLTHLLRFLIDFSLRLLLSSFNDYILHLIISFFVFACIWNRWDAYWRAELATFDRGLRLIDLFDNQSWSHSRFAFLHYDFFCLCLCCLSSWSGLLDLFGSDFRRGRLTLFTLLHLDIHQWCRLGVRLSQSLLLRDLDGKHCHMHQVWQVGLHIALVNINDFEGVLDQQLLALDGVLSLPSVVRLDLSQQRWDASVVWQTDKEVKDKWRGTLCSSYGSFLGTLEKSLGDSEGVLCTTLESW